ncbi:hypothetical protein TAO_1272 [Candidatus Nitrosoglobus terrae]|uniref:EF-hand domain-containing protein n=1 Tax=Candidatus Nitrosoglobus terrae TaxID=1630141 RepID=A0A1Q2SNE7_9GAMM|nr:hypothetical protein TAO_1272 [Candidatus Nitrosoglobus terrae]
MILLMQVRIERDKVLSFDEIDTILNRSDLNRYFIKSDINQDRVLNFREFSSQYVDLIERNKRLEEIKRKKEEEKRQ